MSSAKPASKKSKKWQRAYERDLRQIGERVRAARKHVGISQVTLAAQMGVSLNTVSTIEQGERNFSVEHLLLLAAHLGVSPQTILIGAPDSGDGQT